MDKNSTSEPTHQGDGVDINGFTYIIVFVIGLIFLLLSVGIACVRLRMSQPLNIFNILAGFPPPRNAGEEELQDMEQGIRDGHDDHNMDNSFESYPKLLYSEVEKKSDSSVSSSCSICLGDYKEADTLRMLPDCGHVYHLACVDPWLRFHSTCPICRKSSVQSSIIV
ncbi:RING-H2 finger protein ATL70-like [Lotus japonicus]|uniref:RING-H2 finger protein ATL70-like n=1 Tax=Lotus japonicus TaxID=34305 RepID=UPI00258B6FDD|nr:RING-H2 finger protein ATL70-like [Lotus japonicus]